MEGNERLVLTPGEVGRELGLTPRQIHNLRAAGQLPAIRVAHGEHRSTWRFLPSAVLAYLDAINEDERR